MRARIGVTVLAVLSSTAALVSPTRAAPALPPPSFGRTLDIGLVSGTVLVTLANHSSFTLTSQDRNIPLGSLIDTTHGRVDLCAASAPIATAAAGVEDAQFYGGVFHVRQSSLLPVTQIRLAGGNFAACRMPAHAHPAGGLPHRVLRLLRASGTGRFQTTGRYAAATVRGTIWLTEDFCDGTLVRVTQGVVSVENLVTHATVTVTAGQRYFARAPGA